ncbi:hypothetical protein RRG08_000468 [Elysia crispata]|uniref:Uncharacterized protein n=1 Tax=Elysia crispata TaxID=231223 RepID=A0AAE0YDQ5_9GAST|nr:hypothetical protein RRG08_000468 [Elysia crispata]
MLLGYTFRQNRTINMMRARGIDWYPSLAEAGDMISSLIYLFDSGQLGMEWESGGCREHNVAVIRSLGIGHWPREPDDDTPGLWLTSNPDRERWVVGILMGLTEEMGCGACSPQADVSRISPEGLLRQTTWSVSREIKAPRRVGNQLDNTLLAWTTEGQAIVCCWGQFDLQLLE